jgi:hypothetical protein
LQPYTEAVQKSSDASLDMDVLMHPYEYAVFLAWTWMS